MLPPWPSILNLLSGITSKNYTSLICCPYCGNSDCYVKYGFYNRYLFNDELIQIQRYRCDNDQCPQRTFSILSHAFLRVARASLCMFMHVLQMKKDGFSIAIIARYTGSNWPRIQRWIAKAQQIKEWIDAERKQSPPCMLPKNEWPNFIRDFSWALYPRRYPVVVINTKRISL